MEGRECHNQTSQSFQDTQRNGKIYTQINDVRSRSFGLGIWVLIASVPDHYILFTFDKKMVRDAVIFEISHITKHSISKQRCFFKLIERRWVIPWQVSASPVAL